MLPLHSWWICIAALLLLTVTHLRARQRLRNHSPLLRDVQRGYVIVEILIEIAIAVAISVATFALTKIKGARPARPQVPTNREGTCVRRIYGTVWVDDPMTLAIKPLAPQPIKKKIKGPLGIGSKKVTSNYNYPWVLHFCWSSPVDALLELRGAGVSAWAGWVTENAQITVNAPNLWGGDDSEGGIVGAFDVLFGREGQTPSTYLADEFGAQQSAHLGKFTTIYRGGKFGASSPNPRPLSLLLMRIATDWLDDTPWYIEKAGIFVAGQVEQGFLYDTACPATIDVDDSEAGFGGLGPLTEWIIRKQFAGIYQAWSPYTNDAANSGLTWTNSFSLKNAEGVVTNYAPPGADYYATDVAAAAATVGWSVTVSGSDTFLMWTGAGSFVGNRGGLSYTVTYRRGLQAMNPAHLLYDSLTHLDMLGEPVGSLNDDHWRAAAERLYDEGFGVCTDYDADEESIAEFHQRICNVIGAGLSQSRVDGLWYLDLIRAAGDDELPVITDADVIEYQGTQIQPQEVVNVIRVQWFDPITKATRLTAPVGSLAAIASAGRQNAQIRTYLEVPSEELALRLARRDLTAFSSALNKFELKVLHRFRGLRLGMLVRLQLPSEGIADMVCVVGAVDQGDRIAGAISLTLVQNAFDLPATVHVAKSPGLGQAPSTTPTQSPHRIALETPYAELASAMSTADLAALPASAGFLETAATQPGTAINYDLYTQLGAEPYANQDAADWTPSALVVEAADQKTTAFTLSGGALLDRVAAGTWALWGEEIVRVDALDIDASTVQFGRGCIDTPPIAHAAGDRIWFCGEWAGIDPRQYATADTVNAKLLTRTTAGLLALADATALSLTMNQRAARPYAPQHVLVGGVAYPTAVVDDVTVTWSHRDRVAQVATIVDTTNGDIGPEDGVTYSYEVYDDDTNTLLDSGSGLTDTSIDLTAPGSTTNTRVEIWAVRDGLDSWRRHIFVFAFSPVPSIPYANAFLLKFTGGALVDKVSGSTFTNNTPSYIAADSVAGVDGAAIDFAPTIATHAGYIASLPADVLNQGEWIFEKYINLTGINAASSVQVYLKETSAASTLTTDAGIVAGIRLTNNDSTHGNVTIVTAPSHGNGTGRTTQTVVKTKGSWIHVSFRKVASSSLSNSGTVYVYIDGTLVATTTSGAWTPTSGASFLHLWATLGSGSVSSTVAVDEILCAWWANKTVALADPNSPSSLGGGVAPPDFTPQIYYPGG